MVSLTVVDVSSWLSGYGCGLSASVVANFSTCGAHPCVSYCTPWPYIEMYTHDVVLDPADGNCRNQLTALASEKIEY